VKAGTAVRFVKMPDWVATLPEQSRRVFESCYGRTYRIQDIDENGLCVLDVSADIDHQFGGFMNDIRLEPDYLAEV
jgi:hypothetical protein